MHFRINKGHTKKQIHARKRDGYTLMELMVVITIIGLLAGAVTVGVRHFLVRGQQNTAKIEIGAIVAAAEFYKQEQGKYPPEEELDILSQKSPQTGEVYLDGDTTDPWGNEYEYFVDEDGIEVICFGKDGKQGGTGANQDISSLDLKKNSSSAKTGQ